jgi:hypothetical protein
MSSLKSDPVGGLLPLFSVELAAPGTVAVTFSRLLKNSSGPVILSAARNPGSCEIRKLQRSFVARGSPENPLFGVTPQ